MLGFAGSKLELMATSFLVLPLSRYYSYKRVHSSRYRAAKVADCFDLYTVIWGESGLQSE